MDFIHKGQASGDVATTLMNNGFSTNSLRPWIGKDGRTYTAQLHNGKMHAVPSVVANGTLRKDEWKILDEAIVKAAKQRLRVVSDLRSSGLVYNIPNGMGKTVLETETVGDITPANISMDPAKDGENDRVEYDLTNLPLPIIHKDFFYSARQVATSRNLGASIDTTTGELAARRVAEEAEKLVLGTSGPESDQFSFGGGTIYGLKNFPNRITRTITSPLDGGWTGATLVQDILSMRQDSEDAMHYGPWVLYTSPAWDQYLDNDYSTAKGDNTVRQRINAINGIQDVRTADYLGTGFDMILVQQTSDVIRLVVGMDVTTVQWETHGGMRLNFKVMAIMVPQLRSDFHGNCGIVHGSV